MFKLGVPSKQYYYCISALTILTVSYLCTVTYMPMFYSCNGKRSPRQVYSVPHVFRAGPDREKSLAWHAHTRLRNRSCSSEVGSSSVMSTVHESSHVCLPRGSMIGSDQYFVRNPDVRIRSYLTTAPSVLGYLPMAAMDALCQVDARFKRVYSRNMFLQIIHWVRPHVPFLA